MDVFIKQVPVIMAAVAGKGFPANTVLGFGAYMADRVSMTYRDIKEEYKEIAKACVEKGLLDMKVLNREGRRMSVRYEVKDMDVFLHFMENLKAQVDAIKDIEFQKDSEPF